MGLLKGELETPTRDSVAVGVVTGLGSGQWVEHRIDEHNFQITVFFLVVVVVVVLIQKHQAFHSYLSPPTGWKIGRTEGATSGPEKKATFWKLHIYPASNQPHQL